jgi:ubiquinone/menaquinone biosynthesis C-methylase UbiE
MRAYGWLRTLALALVLSAGAIAFLWLVVMRIAAKLHGGAPCPYALGWLTDNPLRRRYMSRVMDRVGIQPGERVLELGPGPGAFTVQAARRAQPGGSLVVVDIQPQMIAAVERRLRDAGLTDVETHVASAYELPIQDGSIDRAFLVTVLPEVPNRQRALRELWRVLKPGGTLSVTEEFLDPDYPLARTTIRWAQSAGFELAARKGNWFLYTLNFRRPA